MRDAHKRCPSKRNDWWVELKQTEKKQKMTNMEIEPTQEDGLMEIEMQEEGFTTPIKAVKQVKLEDQVESPLEVVLKEAKQEFTTPIKLETTESNVMLTPVVFASRARQVFWKNCEDSQVEQVMNMALLKSRIVDVLKTDVNKLKARDNYVGTCQRLAGWFPKTARVLLVVCARNCQSRQYLLGALSNFIEVSLKIDQKNFVLSFDQSCYEFLSEMLDDLNEEMLQDLIQTQVDIVMSRKNVPLAERKQERQQLPEENSKNFLSGFCVVAWGHERSTRIKRWPIARQLCSNSDIRFEYR